MIYYRVPPGTPFYYKHRLLIATLQALGVDGSPWERHSLPELFGMRDAAVRKKHGTALVERSNVGE